MSEENDTSVAAPADLEAAATKIQSLARGKKERKKHKERKVQKAASPVSEAQRAAEEMAANAAFADLDAAAVKIQAIARGTTERKKHKERKAKMAQPPPASETKRAQAEGAPNSDDVPAGVQVEEQPNDAVVLGRRKTAQDMSQDEAATFIQTRARGMIDRKKVKETCCPTCGK